MVRQGARTATILSCQECGAIVMHRAVHDAWHATVDLLLLSGSEPAA
jgi:hypothetical protein